MIPIHLKLSEVDYLFLDSDTFLILGWIEGMAMVGEGIVYFPNDKQSILVSSDEASINTPADSQEIFLSESAGLIHFSNTEGTVHGT